MKSRFLEIAAGAVLALVTASGCDVLTCNSNECVGGLHWTATTADELPLVAGAYTVDLQIEDNQFTIACSVADDGAAQCDEPVQTSGDRAFRVNVQWFGEYTTTIDGMGTTLTRHGINLTVQEHVEGGHRGPSAVGITLLRDGGFQLDEVYAPTYERDESYHGDEDCGFCDSSEARESTWSQ